MPRVKSAKGVIIDFDLLKIKQQIESKPVSIDVKKREAFIDSKMRRRVRKAQTAMPPTILVDKTKLTNAVPSQENKIIDPKPATEPEVKEVHTDHSKQKMRPPKDKE